MHPSAGRRGGGRDETEGEKLFGAVVLLVLLTLSAHKYSCACNYAHAGRVRRVRRLRRGEEGEEGLGFCWQWMWV